MKTAGVATRPGDDDPLWARVRQVVRGQVGQRNFASWIAPLRRTWCDGEIVLEAPDPRHRAEVERRFAGLIGAALAAELGRPCAVRLTVPDVPRSRPLDTPPPPAH